MPQLGRNRERKRYKGRGKILKNRTKENRIRQLDTRPLIMFSAMSLAPVYSNDIISSVCTFKSVIFFSSASTPVTTPTICTAYLSLSGINVGCMETSVHSSHKRTWLFKINRR